MHLLLSKIIHIFYIHKHISCILLGIIWRCILTNSSKGISVWVNRSNYCHFKNKNIKNVCIHISFHVFFHELLVLPETTLTSLRLENSIRKFIWYYTSYSSSRHITEHKQHFLKEDLVDLKLLTTPSPNQWTLLLMFIYNDKTPTLQL